MTIRDIITMADSLKPNEIDEMAKIRWINNIDGRVFCEIYKGDPEEYHKKVRDNESLTVPEPYASLYLPYMTAMIAFSKGDYEGYRIGMLEYETAFLQYARYFLRNR